MKKKILVIEDEELLRTSIVELLELEDYEALGACNGEEGIVIAKRDLPDLIISDIMMPIKNGYEVVQELRNDFTTSKIPIIFLSAKADKQDSRFGMSLGVEDYITKPFSKQELFNTIKTRLERVETYEKHYDKKVVDLKISLASTLPHELRTPLNGILASSQFLLNRSIDLSKEDINELHQTIYSSALRLNRLITNYLLFFDLEIISSNSQTCTNLQGLFLESTAYTIESTISKRFEDENRQFDVAYNIQNLPIQIEETYLSKICEELADNAFKFSEPNFKVEVTTSIENNVYFLSVSNKGIVIDKDEALKIEAYVQFKRDVYEQQGSGLGLAIVQKICQIFNGSFEIKNIDNLYTVSTVRLPLHII